MLFKKCGILGVGLLFFFLQNHVRGFVPEERFDAKTLAACSGEHVHVRLAQWSAEVQNLIGLLQGLLQKIDAGFYIPASHSRQKISLFICEIINNLYKHKRKSLITNGLHNVDALFLETYEHIVLLKKLIESQFSDLDDFSIDQKRDISIDLVKKKTSEDVRQELNDLKYLIEQFGVTYINRAARLVEDMAAWLNGYIYISTWYLYAPFFPLGGIAIRHLLPDNLKMLIELNWYGGRLPRWTFEVSWIGLPEVSISRDNGESFVGLGLVESYYERLVRAYLFSRLVRYVLDEKYKQLFDAIPDNICNKMSEWWNVLKGMYKKTAEMHSTGFAGIDFEDEELIGFEQQKNSVSDMIAYITKPEEYVTRGHVIQKNALLIGPSGTGKTLFVHALVGEINKQFRLQEKRAEVELIELKYNEFDASNVLNFFAILLKKMRAIAPCILFIDEFHHDLDMANRIGFYGGLSAMMDELYASGNLSDQIFIIGATTKPELIPGDMFFYKRFGRNIYFDLPSAEQRRQFFTLAFVKNLAVDENKIDIGTYVRQTVGCSYGQLALIVSSARFKANNIEIQHEHIQKAIDQKIYHLFDEINLLPYEKESVAVHQAGHVLAALIFQPQSPLEFATIRGFRKPGQKADLSKNIYTEYGVLVRYDSYEGGARISVEELKKNVRILIAGRCAEEVLLGGHLRNHHDHEREEALYIINTAILDTVFADAKKNISQNLLLSFEREIVEMFEKNKKTVRLVANLLKERTTLTAADIVNITCVR